jgi:hypothetical protein
MEVCSYKDPDITEEMANAVYYYAMLPSNDRIKIDI